MRIHVDPCLLKMPQVRSISAEICDDATFFPLIGQPSVEPSWSLAWGEPAAKRRFAVAETGFFWDAMHIDTQGLYQFSSLNTASARDAMESLSPPVSARTLIDLAPLPRSKYRQPEQDVEWSGVVFACQNPTDRSIHSVASTEDWWRFYESCCKYYGSRLFVKLHPWNGGSVETRMRAIAKGQGCQVGRAGHKVIERCDHVVLFSSSFSVDCMLRDVPVKQGAPGYFSGTGAVSYCAGDPKAPLRPTAERSRQLVDFLVWRYCFSMDCTLDFWRRLLVHFAKSRRLFPLESDMSYGAYLQSMIKNALPA